MVDHDLPRLIAESFTNRPGQFVPRAATLAGCQALLNGTHDDLPADALHMAGSLDDALASA